MAKDPAFLFYPGDYLRDTQTLSEKSQVAYDRIMCEHMRNICITQQQLKFFTKRLNEDENEELMFILDKVDGGYQIGWVAESLIKRRKYSESRRNNRLAVKKDKKDTSKTYVPHMEDESEDKDIIDYESIKTTWNFFAGNYGLPKIKALTKPRLAKLNIRLKEDFDLVEILRIAEQSNFLKGDNKTGWKLTFDWLIENEKNYIKILEGNYTNETSEQDLTDDDKRRLSESIKSDNRYK